MFRRKQNVSRGTGSDPFSRSSLSFVRLCALCTNGEERMERKVHHHERLREKRVRWCVDVFLVSLCHFRERGDDR